MRARNIKPSLFVNEHLAFAAPIHTVIFTGLWCIADRRGVLEDRPQRIHTLINPGRSLATTRNSLLWLAEQKFIVRYKAGDINVIKVLNFSKHQNPHKDEKPSDLPDYGVSTMPAPCSNGCNTVPASGKPESTGLIPDSGLLIADSSLREIPQPPLEKGATRQRRSEYRREKDEATERWQALIQSGGKDRDSRVQAALDAIGGWNRVAMRNGHDDSTVRAAFCDAYVGASA
jgi:hypothetical protein